ncbi:MAG: anthranilate phosphoribosyltransferase [Candidatus Limnocylindria bacterium]
MSGGVGRPAVAAAVEMAASGAPLPAPLAEAAMEELMDGAAPATQVAALLAMLHLRGETAEELAAFAQVMRSRAVPVDAPADAVDLCGTGADHSGSFNISTVASFVVAGAGVPVAKHGNRAVTGRCGSADLVEALGIALDPGPATVARSIREAGFGFMFAPAYHPAMKHAMPIRRELPMRTVFNLLGPLSSPAGVRRQLLGVADPRLLERIAGALAHLEVERALVVHGADGLDELSLAGPNRGLLVEGSSVTEMSVDPRDLGLRAASRDAMAGGDAQLNSAIALSLLGGEPGPARDVVLLNAGAALFVAGRATTVAEGVALAVESVDSGRAADVVPAAAEIAG